VKILTTLKERIIERRDRDPLVIKYFYCHYQKVPLCCTQRRQNYIKCDETDWMSLEDFKKYCLECQKKIFKILESEKL